jgi:NAD(P)-dependent dehydrogenase (short-subunit alcohol dehydrogenase family)
LLKATLRLASRLLGKTVVVVGAGGNLGPIWVEALLGEGAEVIACGLGATADPALARLASDHGGALTVIDLDISHPDGVDVTGIVAALGDSRVSGVVLNAGIDSVPGTGKVALTDYSFDDWQSVFQVNVFGVVAAFNALLPYLASPSSVVTLGSMYGVVSPKPAMYSHFNDGEGSMKNPAYGASKAALLAVTKQYATYLAPQGVRVNMLTLGGVAAGQDEGFVTKFVDHVPQARMVPREELPGALTFLLSDDSLSMTGHNLIVDGGYTTW